MSRQKWAELEPACLSTVCVQKLVHVGATYTQHVIEPQHSPEAGVIIRFQVQSPTRLRGKWQLSDWSPAPHLPGRALHHWLH